MNFDDLDRKLRIHETLHDQHVLPGIRIVIRLDGRNFTRLTKIEWGLEAPFDIRFRDAMLATTRHLMDCGFGVSYGYVQSDEISLLLRADDGTFDRKVRKLLSVLAGEASACFSLAMQRHAGFDARISQLPSDALVVDYFRWRHEDAHRNALNAHCYWLLRGQGESARSATARLSGLSIAEKNELLFRHDINFNDLPAWQKRGMGVHWETYEKAGRNPRTGEATTTQRRRLRTHEVLPLGESYADFVRARLAE
ncbi:tRNA(His) guanylyltransferase Thg1 family protein [Lysobacter brunescens]|uniref:tRNA(His) guanylyltransferase n=1 Tax=Lysobacter brunescens TaxID=262323 RepID=A0ABW2Y7R7_9GAMM